MLLDVTQTDITQNVNPNALRPECDYGTNGFRHPTSRYRQSDLVPSREESLSQTSPGGLASQHARESDRRNLLQRVG